MHILLFMARDACCRSVFEPQGLMTALAVDQFVLAAQEKAGLVVVEGGFLPGNFPVTRSTQIAFLSLMRVILFVAGNTVGRCLV